MIDNNEKLSDHAKQLFRIEESLIQRQEFNACFIVVFAIMAVIVALLILVLLKLHDMKGMEYAPALRANQVVGGEAREAASRTSGNPVAVSFDVAERNGA